MFVKGNMFDVQHDNTGISRTSTLIIESNVEIDIIGEKAYRWLKKIKDSLPDSKLTVSSPYFRNYCFFYHLTSYRGNL